MWDRRTQHGMYRKQRDGLKKGRVRGRIKRCRGRKTVYGERKEKKVLPYGRME